MAKIIELILTSVQAGEGTDENPNHPIHQLWTKDGRLLVQSDFTLNSHQIDVALAGLASG